MAAIKSSRKVQRSWEALTPPLADFILEYVQAQGFTTPTPVQYNVIPLLSGNKDVVVEAVTGSGKTLSFLIPVLQRLLRWQEPHSKHHIQAVIVAPTRELASQIFSVLCGMLKFHNPSEELLVYGQTDERRPQTTQPVIVPQLLIGGQSKAKEDVAKFLRLSPNLLIGCPGRVAEILGSTHVKVTASSFDILCLDEADRLLDLGFSAELTRILAFLPKQRRTGLFSASMSEAVDQLIKVGMTYPHRVTVRVKKLSGELVQESKTPAALRMHYLVVKASQKFPALIQLLGALDPRPLRTIVFFASCFEVMYFSRVFRGNIRGYSLVGLHGKLEPRVRERNFQTFLTSSTPSILFTTDIAARGLDVPLVDLVVQYDPPTDTKVFIHRSGRAGRAGRLGQAVVLLQPGREEGYTELLQVRQTPITPLPEPAISVSVDEAAKLTTRIRAQAVGDRDIFQLGTRAFVSWTRSYMEHSAKSIFRLADLDWVDLAHAFGLVALPKMPELRGLDVDRSLGLAIVTDAIAYRDTARERKRVEELAAWKAERANRTGTKERGEPVRKRVKNEAWSGKHEKEDEKVARREKKRRKREVERVSKMSEGEKAEHRKLADLIAEIRSMNRAKLVSRGKEEFDGFDD